MTGIERVSNDTMRLPDGTLVYSLAKAIEESKKVRPVDISADELILSTFYAQKENPIYGRTVVFKEIFLLDREVFGEYVFTWQKIPGEDTSRLVDYLRQRAGIHLRASAIVRKDFGEKDIIITDDPKRYRLSLDQFDTTATLYRVVHGDPEPEPKALYRFFIKRTNAGLEAWGRRISIEDTHFVPYHFGPYSFVIANKIEGLVDAGLLWREGKKDTRNEVFGLTELGRKAIAGKFSRLSKQDRENMETKREGYDQLGRDGILGFTYQAYPQYKAKSRIGKRYKLITWGRGKG